MNIEWKSHVPLLVSGIFLLITTVIWQNGGAVTPGANIFAPQTIFAIITSEISIGFLVAWILIHFVEKPAKVAANSDFASKQKIISQNIFDYIYGVKVPKSLFKFIEESILEAIFFRKKLDVEYNFIQELPEHWVIRATTSFDVHNISSERQVYPVKGAFEKCHEPCDGYDGELGLVSLFVDNKAISADAIASAEEVIPDTKELHTYSHDIEIPSGQSRNVKIIFILRKNKMDSEFWRSNDSAESVTFKIQHPPGLEINTTAVHAKRVFDYQHAENNSIRLEINEPIMPQNGIMFWWGKP